MISASLLLSSASMENSVLVKKETTAVVYATTVLDT
jgi:hypothetical protein